MIEEEIKQRNESKEFLKDLQYYLFQNKMSPKIDKLFILLDNDEKRIAELESTNKKISDECHKLVDSLEKKQKRVEELEAQIEKVKHYLDYDIPHDLINEATTKIWRMLK